MKPKYKMHSILNHQIHLHYQEFLQIRT